MCLSASGAQRLEGKKHELIVIILFIFCLLCLSVILSSIVLYKMCLKNILIDGPNF